MFILKWIGGLFLSLIIWLAVALFGALEGWWLAPMGEQGDTQAFFDETKKLINLQKSGNTAIILIENGVPVARDYSGSAEPVNGDTLFPLASMSKLFSAYGTFALANTGQIDLDKPIHHYLTRWQLPASGFQNDRVTTRQLLSHTAGLTDGLGFGDYSANETLPSLEQSLNNPRSGSGNKAIQLGYEPGSQWQYSGGGYLMTELLVEEAAGVGFANWMQSSVFEPLGMTRSTYQYLPELDNVSSSFSPGGDIAPSYKYASLAATGLSSTSNDLIAFTLALIKDDQRSNTQSIARKLRQPLGHTMGAAIWGPGAMLYAPVADGDFIYGHDGANEPAINTSLRVNPINGDAIIVLSNGQKDLATRLGYEWTLWQTGTPDFLHIEKAIASALIPGSIGGILIVLFFGYLFMRKRKSTRH